MAGSSHVEPGGQTEIRTKLNTMGKSGEMMRRVMLKTNDPMNAEMAFTLRVIVTPLPKEEGASAPSQ